MIWTTQPNICTPLGPCRGEEKVMLMRLCCKDLAENLRGPLSRSESCVSKKRRMIVG